ncbi:MAG: hypothetical protein K6G89_06815 [Clostridia bacterium]|nr:hypothetical protein [Clostridia bacterium]
MKQRVLFVIWIITVTLMLLVACSNVNEDGTRFRIDFGAVEDDHWDISNVKMEYDVNALKKRISGDNAFVYVSSMVDNHDDIAKQFGFNTLQICPIVDEIIEYRDESENQMRRLLIWPTGKIRYDTGVEETSFETKVSKEYCAELSKEVLKNYGLTNQRFDSEWYYSERTLTDPADNQTKVIGYTVFLYFLLDGVKLYGEPRATVQFNGNGEVVSIMYKMPDYYEAGECELTNIRQALKSIEKGNIPMMYGLEEAPEKVTIEDVELCYYSQTFDVNTVVAQPVYVFSATGHYKEENRQFRIVVQAN